MARFEDVLPALRAGRIIQGGAKGSELTVSKTNLSVLRPEDILDGEWAIVRDHLDYCEPTSAGHALWLADCTYTGLADQWPHVNQQRFNLCAAAVLAWHAAAHPAPPEPMTCPCCGAPDAKGRKRVPNEYGDLCARCVADGAGEPAPPAVAPYSEPKSAGEAAFDIDDEAEPWSDLTPECRAWYEKLAERAIAWWAAQQNDEAWQCRECQCIWRKWSGSTGEMVSLWDGAQDAKACCNNAPMKLRPVKLGGCGAPPAVASGDGSLDALTDIAIAASHFADKNAPHSRESYRDVAQAVRAAVIAELADLDDLTVDAIVEHLDAGGFPPTGHSVVRAVLAYVARGNLRRGGRL